MPGKLPDIRAALGEKLVRFRDEVCAPYAAMAEQYAKQNASVDRMDKNGNERKLTGGSNKFSKPVAMTAKMQAEAEKTRTMEERKPWENMSEDARKLLHGYVIDDGKSLGFGIAHRVEYGKALEYSNDGKYAILRPTIEHFRAEFMEKAQEFFGK